MPHIMPGALICHSAICIAKQYWCKSEEVTSVYNSLDLFIKYP